MVQCGECKHFSNNDCTWWLRPIKNNMTHPECFLPKTLQDYPLIPQGKAYPPSYGKCRYCGESLTGQQISYCSEAHSITYSRRFWWEKVRWRIWERDNGSCVVCKTEIQLKNAEIDHIQAQMNGGDYWAHTNLRTLCTQCHKRKTKQDFHILKRTDEGTVTLDGFLKKGDTKL